MPSYFQRHPTPHAKSFIWFRWIKEQWLAPSTASRLLNSSSLSSSCLHQETPTPALFSSHPPFNNVPDLRPQTLLLHPILPPLPSSPLSPSLLTLRPITPSFLPPAPLSLPFSIDASASLLRVATAGSFPSRLPNARSQMQQVQASPFQTLFVEEMG